MVSIICDKMTGEKQRGQRVIMTGKERIGGTWLMVLSPRRGWEVVQAGPYGVHSSQISVFVLFLSFFVCRTGALLDAGCRSCDSLTNYGSRSSNYQVIRVLISLCCGNSDSLRRLSQRCRVDTFNYYYYYLIFFT